MSAYNTLAGVDFTQLVGHRVALTHSADGEGDFAFVSGHGFDAFEGQVQVYRRLGAKEWLLEQIIQSPAGEVENFGVSVASDGNWTHHWRQRVW